MSLIENWRIALRALSANKLRSLLTMLGIVIGVGAVVALMAIGNGATASITGQIEGIGSNLVSVIAGRFDRNARSQRPDPLTYANFQMLQRKVTGAQAMIASYQRSLQVVYGSESADLTIEATLPEYEVVRAATVERGHFFTTQDNTRQARVAVIGANVSEKLFRGLNPIGRRIKINGIFFNVIGLLEKKGGGGFGPPTLDDYVIIPLETGYASLFGTSALENGERIVSIISISAVDADSVDGLIVQVERLLRRERNLSLKDDLNFSVISQNAFLDAFSVINNTLAAFLGAIAGISLLVGGIGIMNIMLVSVTERTREIGLRKAVGATRNTILVQFLVETIVLSLSGGILGIIIGWLVAWAVRAANIIQAEVTPFSVILAFGFASAVGLLFGIYPAYRAAGLSPIQALRYE